MSKNVDITKNGSWFSSKHHVTANSLICVFIDDTLRIGSSSPTTLLHICHHTSSCSWSAQSRRNQEETEKQSKHCHCQGGLWGLHKTCELFLPTFSSNPSNLPFSNCQVEDAIPDNTLYVFSWQVVRVDHKAH